MNLIVETVITGPFQENSFIGWDLNSDEAFLVDPGDDAHLIIDVIESNDLVPKAIINTHAHLDHIGAIQQLKEEGNTIIGIEITDKSIDIQNFNFKNHKKIVLLLGSERNGIGNINILDHSIAIPMFGKNSSMNVIHSLSIALYEVTNQLK